MSPNTSMAEGDKQFVLVVDDAPESTRRPNVIPPNLLIVAISRLAVLLLALTAGSMAQTHDAPARLLERFLDNMKNDLARLPDYVCMESTERFTRPTAEGPWQKVDTLRFEVAVVKDRELYALPHGRFQDQPLAAMVGRGTVGTGGFGSFARHVFLASTERFRYRGDTDSDGRRLVGYDYDVAFERSRYRLRSGTAESTVGFQGAFWVDSETLDLVRLEVEAYDMPEKLGLAQAETALEYARVMIDGTEVLLPVSATLTVAAVNGEENLNRTRITACRHYRAASVLRFEETSDTGPAPTPAAMSTRLRTGTVLELRLTSSFDPATANPGDEVQAVIAKAVKSADEFLIPEGAAVLGRVVRLDAQSQPFRVQTIALEFDTLAVADRKIEFTATMQEAGPASGLLKQAQRLDPKFERHSGRHLDVLVREVQRGQGILLWDARRGPLPKGLRMRWRVD